MKLCELCITKNREALWTLHGKKWRSSASSTQREKEKLHKLCTTRNNNKKTLWALKVRHKKTLRALHNKKQRNYASSTQQKREKLRKLCTTRKKNSMSFTQQETSIESSEGKTRKNSTGFAQQETTIDKLPKLWG